MSPLSSGARFPWSGWEPTDQRTQPLSR